MIDPCVLNIYARMFFFYQIYWNGKFTEYDYVKLYVEQEMVAHSIILAWKIPWMEEPGRLRSMGL